MSRMVVDASVVINWVLPTRADEAETDRALDLLRHVKRGQITLLQPPHWLVEVSAVITRLSPQTAIDDMTDLYEMELSVVNTVEVYRKAIQLSHHLGQHLFDTLYHAVALHEVDCTLVTADLRYYEKASVYGAICLLRDFAP